MIDLHIHTNKSDGKYTPKEIIKKAKENNIDIISITDHDTTDAYSDDLFSYAKENNIKLIPGVEISTKINKCGIHILGYNIDLTNKKLKNKLYELRNARHIYLKEVTNKLKELGYIVNIEELEKIDSVTKAHIALDIVTNDKNKELLIEKFDHIPTKGEFIENIMNEGCEAYIRKNTITPIEAAKLIKEANGKAVLAHPVAYKYEDELKDQEILSLIKEMNIDAIEAYYIYIDKDNIKYNDIEQWKNFAIENDLYYTIGSDFHNEDNIRPVIGLINDLKLEDIEIQKILNFINK